MRTFVLCEFGQPEGMLAAAGALVKDGFSRIDTHTPYPVHGIDEALGLPKSKVPLIVLCGGITGCLGGYAMQWWMNSVDYAINVGGRPPHFPPAFIPITFECTILLSALSAFFGCLALFRFPALHHPVFEAQGFRGTIDRFWLSVEIDAKGKDSERIKEVAGRHGATSTTLVEVAP